MRIRLLLFALLMCSVAQGQYIFHAAVKDDKTKKPLPGVTVTIINPLKNAISNERGLVSFNDILPDSITVQFSHAGYETQIRQYNLPLRDTVEVLLKEADNDLGEIVIQSTRTSRSIGNTPTRVEVIDKEELDEKNNMRPANVSMLLHESTGMQVQQTSATSGSASIRVQGLDGRYTQLLKDGYPNFGNFASGLSILEIPPLDLKQVEIIKGPASTLYGGGAIAGVINFISKTPKEKGEYNFLLNQSNIGQTNIGGYAAKRKGKFGYAVLGLVNFQKAYDVDKDDFSEVPKGHNFTINPRLFYYPSSNTSLMVGNSFTKGNMKGGDMQVIEGKPDANHVYFEQNKTLRNITTLEFEKKFDNNSSLKFKQSYSIFDRTINIPDYTFAGLNKNSFSDVSYLLNKENYSLISGVNLLYDNFNQKHTDTLNAKSFTVGIYTQHTWDISDYIKLESGLRADFVNYSNINFKKNQAFLLPRISALFKFNNHWSSRIGGGLGYKTPTIFTEETETIQYRNVSPLINVKSEKSIGATADVNYKGNISDELFFGMNQMFFITQINHPLLLQQGGDNYFFINAAKPVVSKGFETNLKFILKEDYQLFVGYTFTDAKAKYYSGIDYLPLVPKNKLNLALIYEKEKNFKLGFEGYFTDHQYLTDRAKTPSYWEFGFMAEKTLAKHFSAFINFENFTDTRQSKYKRVVNPPNTNPTFDEIWTHLEGFTFNGGIKLSF